MTDTREREALTARLVTALENSTRIHETAAKELTALREANASRFEEIEDELRSWTSKLDNLVRETMKTNELLSEDQEDRKKEAEEKRKIEEDERLWRRKLEERKLARSEELEDDTRATFKKTVVEAWGMVKHPLGYLMAGIMTWIAVNYFSEPSAVLVPTANPSPPTLTVSPEHPDQ